jgi:predicted RNA-binding protein YlqC (UPF0109 family)
MLEGDTYSLGRQSAIAEALGFYRMLGRDGNTAAAIRELIAVPVPTENVIRPERL